MKTVSDVANLFLDSKKCLPKVTESEEKFLSVHTSGEIKVPNVNSLEECLSNFDNGDILEVELNLDESARANIYSNKIAQTSAFIADLDVIQDQVENDSKFELRILISKKTNNSYLNVYNYEAFTNHLKNKTFRNLLHIFNSLIYEKSIDVIYFLDRDINFSTSSITFVSGNCDSGGDQREKNRSNLVERRNEVCHFNQSSEFKLTPHDFYVKDKPANNDYLINLLDKLSILISITFIADVSEIRNENLLYYKLNGYKTLSGELNISQISNKSIDIYVGIIDWIYSKGGLNDKLGLARNILSLNLAEDSIELSENTYSSILSNYEIYLKSNVEQYIKVKNKISDHLIEASQKASKIVKDLNSTFRNNFFAFFSFFFTVLIIRIVGTGDTDHIFTEEIAYLAFAFLGTSLVFLLITAIHSFSKRKRFKNVFNNLKLRYRELLNPEDLTSIFEKTSDHQDDLSYIKKNIIIYSLIWLITILALAIVVYKLAGF